MARYGWILLAGLMLVTASYAQPYAKGNWLIGPAIGDITLGGYDVELTDSSGATTTTLTGRVGIKIQAHTGLFVVKHLNVGLLVDYETYAEESQPTPNPINADQLDGWGDLFVGIYGRYYIPVAERWAIYPELAFGWGGYESLSQYNDDTRTEMKHESIARGFAVSATAGAGYFFSELVSFDIAVSYGVGWLSGSKSVSGLTDKDIDIVLADASFLLGATLFFGD